MLFPIFTHLAFGVDLGFVWVDDVSMSRLKIFVTTLSIFRLRNPEEDPSYQREQFVPQEGRRET
jgi:hypothetical protein